MFKKLNAEYRTSKKKFWLLTFHRFFWSTFCFTFNLMSLSVDITPHGDPRGGGGGGYSDLFFARRLGPRSYRSTPPPLKKYILRISSTPKTFFIPSKNIHFFFWKPKKYWNSKFWAPKIWPKPTYVWKYQSNPLPLGRRRSLDEHSRVDNVWRIQTAFST